MKLPGRKEKKRRAHWRTRLSRARKTGRRQIQVGHRHPRSWHREGNPLVKVLWNELGRNSNIAEQRGRVRIHGTQVEYREWPLDWTPIERKTGTEPSYGL